jgi:hypothetical protein
MVDNDKNSEQIDDDILRCKEDILRARDIMPPYKQQTGENTKRRETEIPQFDLAEEIMAEQRKLTAIRRKSPGKKTNVEPVSYTPQQPMPVPENPFDSAQGGLISEIVARDIRRLCGGKV